MNEPPIISVVMSVYNEPIKWLRESIDSILRQTFSDFEFIIICDNPQYQDGIVLLKEYDSSDNRIRIIWNENNIGLTRSLNKGLALSRGKYIARMDADDISLPQRFELQYNFLCGHPDITVLNTYCEFFGDSYNTKVRRDPVYHKQIEKKLPYEDVIVHPAVMINRSAYEIKYDEGQTSSQDYELWLRLLSQGAKFHTMPEVLLRYRISNRQISSNKRAQQQADGRRARYLTFCRVFHAAGLDDLKVITVKDSIEAYRLLCSQGYHQLEKTALFYNFFSIPHSLYHFVSILRCSIKFKFSIKQFAILTLSYFNNKWNCYHIDELSSF